MRRRIFEIVQRAQPGDHLSHAYDIFIMVVALVSVTPLMFKEMTYWLNLVDVITVYILMFDYILRWMTQDYRTGKRGWKEFARYPFTPMALIDLLAILPSLGILPEAFKFLRVLRIFKMFRYSKNLLLVGNVLINEKRTLLSVLLFAVGYIFISALVMFAYEPNTFENFFGALYWSTTALTTVGYGDVYPQTDLGKAVSMVSSIFGIAVIALPAGIITGGFVEEIRKRQADSEAYYETHMGPRFSGKTIREHASLSTYFKLHPKVVYYAKIIVFGVFLNGALYVLMRITGLPAWLDTTGTALVAFLLEPAAGLIVGYIDALILAVAANDAGNLLYYALSAIVALVYGILFARGKRITAKRVVLAAFFLVIVSAGISTVLTYALSGGVPDNANEYRYWEMLGGWGIPQPLALFGAVAFDRIIDNLAVFVLVFGITRVVKRRDFTHVESVSESQKIPEASRQNESYVFGIDIGGTNTKVGIFTEEGTLLAKHSFPTRPVRADDSHAHLFEEFQVVLDRSGVSASAVHAIGLAVPGMIAKEDSNHVLPNVDLDIRAYKEFLRSLFNSAEIAVINDASAALLGDVWQGSTAEEGIKDLVFVTLGTGVGSGIIAGGKLITGAHGAAGEVGHICVEPKEGRSCNCGKTGCLEKYASATGLIQTAREIYEEQQAVQVCAPAEDVYPDGKAVFDASMAGDLVAIEAVDRFSRSLALGLSQMASMFDPAYFIIGGGLAGSSEAFLDKLRVYYRDCALVVCRDTPLIVSKLGNDCGIYGAAYYALFGE